MNTKETPKGGYSTRQYWVAIVCGVIVTVLAISVAWMFLPEGFFPWVLIAAVTIGGFALDRAISRKKSDKSGN
jgi:hypothetical protein